MNVVELHPGVVSGQTTFSNRSLRLTGSFDGFGPIWQMDPQPVELAGSEPNVIHASFAAIADSTDGSLGTLWENEHGLNGEFFFSPVYFDLLQQAALSAADLQLSVAFAAREERIEALMLTLQHKTA